MPDEKPTRLELTTARLAEEVQDFVDCYDAGCSTGDELKRRVNALDVALGNYFSAGGHVTVGGDWEA